MKKINPSEINKEDIEIDEYNLSLRYSFNSENLPREFEDCYDYFNTINVDIIYYDEENEIESVIGNIELMTIDFERAKIDTFSYFEVIDEHSMEISDMLFDVVSKDYLSLDQKIHRHFDLIEFDYLDDDDDDEIISIYNENTCIIYSFNIHSNFRGHSIGEIVLNDVLIKFRYQFGLFIVKPFPLQYCDSQKEIDTWGEKYSNKEEDEEKNTNKLKNFYKSIGFEEIKGFEKLLFISSDTYNEQLSPRPHL